MKVRALLVSVAATMLAMSVFSSSVQAQSTWDTIKSTKMIRVGCATSEPWYYRDPKTKKWSGIGPGIAGLLAEEMKVGWECVETTWGNAVAGLQANQFDMVVALDATPQRALAIDFATGTLLYYAVGIMVPENSNIDTWAQLNKSEMKVAVALGTSNDRAITGLLPNATIVRAKTYAEVLATYLAGRVDAAGGSAMSLAFGAREQMGGHKVVIPKPPSASTTSIGIRKEDDKKWRDWLSIAVDYYYHRGQTKKVYADFIVSRGMDPKMAPSIRLSDMQ
jgi:polar amino acid transport system substrate-binding protein